MVRSEIRRTKKFGGADVREVTFTSQKRVGWNILVTPTINTGNRIPQTSLIPIPRRGSVKVNKLNLSYGINANTAVIIEWYFLLADSDTGDFIQSAYKAEALWASGQTWLALSAVGFVQTMSDVQVDLSDSTEIVQRTTDRSMHNKGYHLYVEPNATLAVTTIGTVTWTEKAFQFIYVDDFQEWDGYTFEESAS